MCPGAGTNRPASVAPARPAAATDASRRVGNRRNGCGPAPKTPTSGPRYQRLAQRLGKKKAIVAIQHSILVAVRHMLTDGVDYADLGGDHFARLDPEAAMRRIVRQANAPGFTVRFDRSRPLDNPHG